MFVDEDVECVGMKGSVKLQVYEDVEHWELRSVKRRACEGFHFTENCQDLFLLLLFLLFLLLHCIFLFL